MYQLCFSYGAYGGGMFGSSVETTVKREKLVGGGNVPKIMSQCIGFLDDPYHLKENGIFRLPGNEKTVGPDNVLLYKVLLLLRFNI